MGPTTLVGMAVLILFLPLVKFVMTRMLVIRRERVQMTDQRVNIVNAMLQGVRTEVCDALSTSTKSSHAV
jgi:hypothetical protein